MDQTNLFSNTDVIGSVITAAGLGATFLSIIRDPEIKDRKQFILIRPDYQLTFILFILSGLFMLLGLINFFELLKLFLVFLGYFFALAGYSMVIFIFLINSSYTRKLLRSFIKYYFSYDILEPKAIKDPFE